MKGSYTRLSQQQREEIALQLRYLVDTLAVPSIVVIVRKSNTVSYELLADREGNVKVSRVQLGGYFIIEHPSRGVLKDMEETDGGSTGRFGAEMGRGDGMRFSSFQLAQGALSQITRSNGCQIRSSEWEGDDWVDAWPVVG